MISALPSIRSFVPELAVSTVAAIVLWIAAGNSLGLWLGGFGLVALLAPPFVLRRRGWGERAIAVGCAADPVVAVWLISAVSGDATVAAWLWCSILLYTVAGAAGVLALLVQAVRIPAIISSAAAIVLVFAWLAYPVWGGHSIDRARAAVLSRYHPLLAANGQLAPLGIWLEQSLVYRHTVLGQDVPYSLPRTVWPSATLHLLIVALAAGATRLMEPGPSSGDRPFGSTDRP